ncbi:MAG: DUF192 domain-containing protein [Pseudomonadota bacterium]|nr:DUF192 domain-containing protein [Pseudomonadota bacterium]
MNKRWREPAVWFCLTVWLAAAATPSSFAQTAAQTLPALTLNAGIHNITAELAQSAEERATGLMFRETMQTNHGMLFAFEEAGQQCFWMKNTLLPLDVAFVADDGTIVNLDRMKPRSLDAHCSSKPVRFVLEMNEGWFAKRGIAAGARLTGKPFTP